MTSDDLWAVEIATLAQCTSEEAATAVERFGGEAVLAFAKRCGRLPSEGSIKELVVQLVVAWEPIAEIVETAVASLHSLAECWYGMQGKPTRYERIQQSVAQRGPRRRKYGGRLAKLRKA